MSDRCPTPLEVRLMVERVRAREAEWRDWAAQIPVVVGEALARYRTARAEEHAFMEERAAAARAWLSELP